jgi:hypothetical protein
MSDGTPSGGSCQTGHLKVAPTYYWPRIVTSLFTVPGAVVR